MVNARTAPPPDARAGFIRRFEDTYGYTPHRFATLAYDATALATCSIASRHRNAAITSETPDTSKLDQNML
jgi:hypothetical protein